MKDLKGIGEKMNGWIDGEVVLNTDEYIIYQGIAEGIGAIKEHRVVDHSKGEWM